jgi:hypothetical protein
MIKKTIRSIQKRGMSSVFDILNTVDRMPVRRRDYFSPSCFIRMSTVPVGKYPRKMPRPRIHLNRALPRLSHLQQSCPAEAMFVKAHWTRFMLKYIFAEVIGEIEYI